MPTFSYREKNVTISVRCGARCRAYHASSMGEGKGPPHNCAPARFLFFGFFNSMESAFPYEENISVQPNPVRRRGLASGNPDGLSAGPTWCFTPRKALTLRRATPTRPGFSRFGGASVGVALLAKPQFFVGPRQPGPDFLGPPAPQLASPSSQNLNSSSGHANQARIFPVRRRLSWRRPPPQSLNSSSGHANMARPSLRQPGLPFSHKKRMQRIYII